MRRRPQARKVAVGQQQASLQGGGQTANKLAEAGERLGSRSKEGAGAALDWQPSEQNPVAAPAR